DGIGGIKQFFTITLPSIKSTTTFLITLGIINGIKVFPLALFNNRPNDAIVNGASTLMLYVYHMTKEGNDALASASAVMLFVIGFTYSLIIR
ncbi:sugar ABC transporter permease, partial [Escherichia coli]|nr:sugar ABC transporter permease [Escherichia coli]